MSKLGLLDILPAVDTVTVAGKKLAIRALSVTDIAYLMVRFEEVRTLMAGGKLTTERLMAMGSEAVAAICVSGVTSKKSTIAERHKLEAHFITLGLEQQVDILSAVVKVTLPKGPGPFVAAVTKLMSLGRSADGASSELPAKMKFRTRTSRTEPESKSPAPS